jgi:hypothetical protein
MTPLEAWKKIMISMPDKVFFPIVRNYLGRIETPFHKPAIIEDLSDFFSREETISRMLALIDGDDVTILSAVFVLGEPSSRLLQKLLDHRFSYLDIHHRLLNLEERLLIYRDREERIRVNPLFRRLLEENVINVETMFPSRPASPRLVSAPWPSDQLLVALLAFSSEYGDQLLKNDGTMRKRSSEEAAVRFPNIHPEQLAIFIRALSLLGCLRADHQFHLTVIPGRLESFSELSAKERALYLQGAVAVAADGETHSQVNECRIAGERIHRYCDALARDRLYDAESLRSLFMSVALKSDYGDEEIARLPGLLTLTGNLIQEDGLWRRAADVTEVSAEEDPGNMMVSQPDFSITLHPGLPLYEAMLATAFLELKRFDLYSNYELNRTSFHRGCARFSPVELRAVLERRSSSIPQNIITTLDNWEKEYSNLTLVRGIIFTVDEERRHLVEHDPDVIPFLKKNIAPGVYLLDPAREREWRRALDNAGVSPLPPVSDLTAEEEEITSAFSFSRPKMTWDSPDSFASADAPSDRDESLPAVEAQDGGELMEKLSEYLSGRAFPKDEEEELSARINKKLILYPEQLIPGLGEKEKNEAKGLDYTGKVRLIERAIAEGNALLEVVERTRGGSPRRVLLKPEDLRKTGTDLLLLGRSLPEEEMVTVTVRRISLVRKLKSSLYAPDLSETGNR